jgi:hypothetical protein
MKLVSRLSVLVLAALLCVSGPLFAGPSQDQSQSQAIPVQLSADQAGQADQGDADQGQSDKNGGNCLIEKIKKLFCKEKDPAALKEAMQKLLEIIVRDLDLCLNSIDGKDANYLKAFPAIGHLNHALSALGKVKPPKHLKVVFKQVNKRISHAKFYLVMNSFDEAAARVESAKEYIASLNNN